MPVMKARTHDVLTIVVSPHLIIISPLIMALGVLVLFAEKIEKLKPNPIHLKISVYIIFSSCVCLCILLIAVLARMGYPLW